MFMKKENKRKEQQKKQKKQQQSKVQKKPSKPQKFQEEEYDEKNNNDNSNDNVNENENVNDINIDEDILFNGAALDDSYTGVDNNENKETDHLMLQTWETLLSEKRQEIDKITEIYKELEARRYNLIDRKIQQLVSIITTVTPDLNERDYSYLHWLNMENKKCISLIRNQIKSDKLKANAYLEEYEKYENNLRKKIEHKESFDEFTMMPYCEVDEAKEALINSTKNLQGEIEGNKLKGEEIIKNTEETYKNYIDEISILESYEKEMMNLKKQLQFEAQKPNFLKRRLLN